MEQYRENGHSYGHLAGLGYGADHQYWENGHSYDHLAGLGYGAKPVLVVFVLYFT
ncbi:hypothetical protein DPMN_117881 [Dreissena polymorpha]|uniref:Uncharacterized protein n=1 Tax=Dreissena polymorpha TaxID=45954 RepID=A0A9D4JLD2_DREPO|nr:hypothetical protein DPMN_117881 [Dreissena polymorpha]